VLIAAITFIQTATFPPAFSTIHRYVFRLQSGVPQEEVEETFIGGCGMKQSREPIAIIGIGCRFPGGADTPAKFWKLLTDGSDAIVDIPPDRWNPDRFYHSDNTKPGKMYVRKGGFLRERVDHFDPRFFGIAPREAEHMDP